jgi:hypothetical protein
MTSEWLPALFGIIGTLLGGSVTLAANWLTSRTQRHLAAEDRIQQNAGVRREAYALFLTSVSALKDRGRELAETIRAGTSEEEKITSLHKACHESWEDMKARRPLVLIVGTGDIPKIVDELHGSLAEYYKLCDDMYRNRPNRWSPKYDKLVSEIDKKFAEFAKDARDYAVASEPDLIIDRRIGFFKKAVTPPGDKVNSAAVTGQQDPGLAT